MLLMLKTESYLHGYGLKVVALHCADRKLIDMLKDHHNVPLNTRAQERWLFLFVWFST